MKAGLICRLLLVAGCIGIAPWQRIGAQTVAATTSPTIDANATRRVVVEVMNRAVGRCYSVVDGWGANHQAMRGVRRISWVPPTAKDYAIITNLGEKAVPTLAAYVKPDVKPSGLIELDAVKFLESIGTPSTIGPLGAALDQENWQVVRLNALDALGKRPEPEAADLIRSVLLTAA